MRDGARFEAIIHGISRSPVGAASPLAGDLLLEIEITGGSLKIGRSVTIAGDGLRMQGIVTGIASCVDLQRPSRFDILCRVPDAAELLTRPPIPGRSTLRIVEA